MTVKEIILAAAGELGLTEKVQAYLDGASENGKAETEKLLHCFNLVENELALDYLPLYAEEEIETLSGAVYYSEFSKRVVRILRVIGESGNAVSFKLFPEFLKTQGGKIIVAYTYAPSEKGLDGESDYILQASVRLFAYGIAAEYSLAIGAFDDAAVWDKKYKDAIAAAYRSRPSRKMRARRWA